MAEYDEMTPYELNMAVQVYAEQMKEETEMNYRIAHATAYWQRVETLKPFDELIGNKAETEKVMSSDEMLANVMRLNAEMQGQYIKEQPTTE